MDIKRLLAQGNLKGALELLVEKGDNTAILLMGRYSRVIKDYRIGICSQETYRLTINQITHAVLRNSNLSVPNQQPVSITPLPNKNTFNEHALLEIVKINKRRRPAIAEEANQVLTKYRTWKDNKTISPSFDPVGRRLRAIQQKATALIERLQQEKETALEDIIGRISTLLQEPIPTYQALAEAYKLSSGRGFNSIYIENQLQAQPDDEEVRITIAEQIEAYTLEISQH